MDNLKNELIALFKDKIRVESSSTGKNSEHYFIMEKDEFLKSIPLLSGNEFILTNLFCAENFENTNGFTLFYVFMKLNFTGFTVLRFTLKNQEANSISSYFPIANWYEREIADGFGIDFIDSPDKRRLFLHEIYPEGFHPLLKSFQNQSIELSTEINPDREYRFNKIDGEGVYQIPVGPVHAGIIEPGHFRFSVIGETVYNLEIRMFYKHRGLEKLAEGKNQEMCLPIAEAVSGDETVANAVCFSADFAAASGYRSGARATECEAHSGSRPPNSTGIDP